MPVTIQSGRHRPQWNHAMTGGVYKASCSFKIINYEPRLRIEANVTAGAVWPRMRTLRIRYLSQGK